MRYPHGPMDSPHGGVGDSGYAPDARRDSPSSWPSLARLRLTAAASAAHPSGRGALCLERAGSWSLRPTPRPVLIRPIDVQKMNWKIRIGLPEQTGVSLTASLLHPSRGDTHAHQDTAESHDGQSPAQPSAVRLSQR